MCQQTAPSGAADPGPPASENWLALTCSDTVAASLRRLGLWSLDGPPQDFDASVWWFKLQFDTPCGLEPFTEALLQFDGLATLCQVWLNGDPLLASRNMFRQHRVVVSHALQSTGNVLLFRFDSLQEALKPKRARPRWRTPMVAHQQLRWFRTTLLGRTPGWSPPAAPVGPWRPLWLELQQTGQLINAQLQASLQGQTGQLQVKCWFKEAPPPNSQPVLTLEGHGCRVQEILIPLDQPGLYGAILTLEDVKPWWPHTHGEPALYEVFLSLVDASGLKRTHRLGHVGFRQVQLDETQGRFALKINNESLFCRGACWMPLDAVSLKATPQAYRLAIEQARNAGMNMLRLAGPTIYEDPVFFELCDELGVMVWQDLMFANMDYPDGDADFLQDVTTEVAQQLSAMVSHPCVMVVCGNSEVEQQAAMWGVDRAHWAPTLFHSLIPTRFAALLKQVVYWPSSAHGGAFPHQPQAGTTSYYGVGAYKLGLDDAITSQVSFATECLALANVPDAATLARAPAGVIPQVHSPAWKSRVYRDQQVGWDFDDIREHYVERLFNLRPDELRAFDPARHLMLARMASAEVMTRTMAAWRTNDAACAGALVWFLRDLWAGAGCGLVDDQGHPKSVLHALSRVQQPLFATIVSRGLNGLFLHLVNETAQEVAGEVELVLYRHGSDEIARRSRPVLLKARASHQWPLTDWLDGFMDLNWTYRFGPMTQDLAVATWKDQHGHPLAQALHFEPSQILQFNGHPGLVATAVKREDGQMEVTVTTQVVAYGVHFEAFGWQASDEFFHLPPGCIKTVVFRPLSTHNGRWYASVTALNARHSSTIILQALAPDPTTAR